MPRILTAADIADFRGRLCDVAAALFVELGESGFNMRELARRLGVSAMTPYRYFRDKDAILAEVRVRAFAQFAAWLENNVANADPEQLANAYLEFALRERTQYCLMFDFAQQPSGELNAAQARLRAVFTALAAELERQGRLVEDPQGVGVGFWAMLHGMAALYFAGAIDGETLHRLVRVSVPALLSGLGASHLNGGKANLWAFRPAMHDPLGYQPAAE